MAGPERYAGTVTRIYPAKREIRIEPEPGFRSVLEKLNVLEMALRDGSQIRCRVKCAHWNGDERVVEFVPGVMRDAVGRMKRAQIVVDEGTACAPFESIETAPLAALEGFDVADENGLIGRIIRTVVTKAGGILEVERSGGGTVLLPSVPELVSDIDFDAKRIVVRDLERFAVENDEEPMEGSDETG